MAPQTVAIIGAGRVGSSVGYLLKRAGFRIAGVAARSRQSAAKAVAFIGEGTPAEAEQAAAADIVFITTPDRAIKEVCDALAARGAFTRGCLVLHMSGAHSLGLLDSAAQAGCSRAVLHPLQSLASREEGINTLPGSYFRVEADAEALETARSLVKALGGAELVMRNWSSDRESAALYHAGAVAVSNYFVALVHYGLSFYQALGADRKEALQAVLPLIKGTLHNIESLGIPEALTGPIARGDADTMREHLRAMRSRAPELAGLYRELARRTLAVAVERKTLTDDAIQDLKNSIDAE